MNTITVSDIKKSGGKAISDTEIAVLIVHSKPKSVVVPYKDYQMMIESLEELEDRLAIATRKNEEAIDTDDFFKRALS